MVVYNGPSLYSEVTEMSFDKIWENIEKHAGEEFHTKKGLSFTYTIYNKGIIPSRTGYRLSAGNFEKALPIIDKIDGPGAISDFVRGPAYVYAILKDKRIR